MSRTRASVVVAVALGVSIGVLVALGLTVQDAVSLSLAVGIQSFSGGYLWRLARDTLPEDFDPVELLGMGLAIGTAASVVLGALLQPWLGSRGWLALPVVAVGLWLLARLQGRRLTRLVGPARKSTLVGLSVAVITGLGTIALNLTRYPLGNSGPWDLYHPDMLFFEGLSASTGVFGPSDSLFLAGGDIRYHWLTYGWVGQIADTVGAADFATLTRVLPVVALLGCGALVVSWTSRYVDRWPATLLAALLLTAGGYVGAANGTILNFDSPSQNLTTLWLVAGLMAALSAVGSLKRWPVAAILALLAFATTAGKVSSGAVLMLPVAAVAVVAWIRRDDSRWPATAVALVSLTAVAGAYVTVVAGSASPGDLEMLSWLSRASSVQGLNSSNGPRGVVLGTSALLLAMAARWWGLAWFVRRPEWRQKPDTVVGVALVVVSVLPVIVLSQGLNETWFALAASAPLSVFSAAGIALAWQWLGNRAALIGTILMGLAIILVVPIVWIPNVTSPTSVRFFGPWIAYAVAAIGALLLTLLLGRGQRWATGIVVGLSALVFASSVSRTAPVLAGVLHAKPVVDVQTPLSLSELGDEGQSQGAAIEGPASTAPTDPAAPLVPPSAASSWTREEVEAAAVLRDLADAGDIIVTNDTESYLVPALVKRRALLAGAPYQATYGSEETAAMVAARREMSLAFIELGDERAFGELCRLGVTWGWVRRDSSERDDWEPYAETVFENDRVAVIRLNGEMCP